MSSEPKPCLDGPATTGRIRPWSEDPLTARARAVWSAADFRPIARSYARGAADFIARLGVRPGEALLDVACGTGNLAIPAARAGARVTGVDIAPNLIAEATREAREAGLPVTFEVGDAESLCHADGEFDTTVTMFGAMFAFRPARAASELLRVTRSGGRIAMANWTSSGLVAQLYLAHAAVLPPPTDLPSPLLWGDEETVRSRFGDRVGQLTCSSQTMELRFPMPPVAVTEVFTTCYGPTVSLLAATEPEGRQWLRSELTRLFTAFNLADDGTTVLPGEYLEVHLLVP